MVGQLIHPLLDDVRGQDQAKRALIISAQPIIMISCSRGHPLEYKRIDVSQASAHVTYPADFILMVTMNPCPCGYLGDKTKECSCTNSQIISYQKRLSGPLLDRIDLVVNVSRVPNEELLFTESLTNCQHISAVGLINQAYTAQNIRYKNSMIYNASLNNNDVKKYAPLSSDAKLLLSKAANRLKLSARSYFKIIKVARTIADLANKNDILAEHIGEALQYRR